MFQQFKDFLYHKKYEILLFALLQHLYVGIFLRDFELYASTIWPINMIILGVGSAGVFIGKGLLKMVLKNFLFFLVLGIPFALPFFRENIYFIEGLSLIYVVYFGIIFWEVFRFLLKPSYINIDIISACACGYFLLIEIFTFMMLFVFSLNPKAITPIDTSTTATVYMDLVYFSTITMTSIGYGDISPKTHDMRLMVSLFGVIGQFYLVILVGILVSKFSSKSEKE